MDAIDILKTARAKIARPEDWGKGRRVYDRPRGTCCAAEAINEAIGCSLQCENNKSAYRALYNAAGLDFEVDSLAEWNDAPERTHAEVKDAFDLAIATLRI